MATVTVPGYRASTRAPQRECCRPKKADEVEGTTHATTGLLLGAGVGLLTSIGTHAHGAAVGAEVGRDLLYGALTAGFALLPDADHPKATFAYSAGALSHGTSHVVAAAFGGHRQGFHSLFGIGLMMLITASCADWWPNRWALGGLAVFIAVCVVAGLKASGFMRHASRRARFGDSARRALVGCGIAALAVTLARPDLWWLVAMGMALHVFEDEFSGHGCALLWPFTNRRFGGDGHQPVKRGGRSARNRRMDSGHGAGRRGGLAGTVAPVPSRPSARRAAGPKSMCLRCMVGECEDCKGQGCGCPQPASSHPGRARRKAAVTPPPELPETPPF
jgi:membrane-bound metal-dependent hydrolase YbcI (DUF457 family)